MEMDKKFSRRKTVDGHKRYLIRGQKTRRNNYDGPLQGGGVNWISTVVQLIGQELLWTKSLNNEWKKYSQQLADNAAAAAIAIIGNNAADDDDYLHY